MGAQEKRRQKRIREYVINRDGSLCCYCDRVLPPQEVTMEHIVPDSKRGTFNTTNLTVACHDCNNKRGNQPFFTYCQQFNFSDDKLDKYKRLYFGNLQIKALNIAKDGCLQQQEVVPLLLIRDACRTLKIKEVDFSHYEREYCFDLKFEEVSPRRQVVRCFDQLIRIIEAECW